MYCMTERTPVPDLGAYEQLVESWPDAVLVIDDQDQRYLVVNGAAEQLVGYGREEIRRLKPGELSHPDDLREITSLRTLVAQRGAVRRPWRMLHRDGSIVQTELTVSRQSIGGRGFTQIVFRPLSGPGPVLEASDWPPILERTSLAVVAADREGIIRYWSAAAEGLYGWPASHAVGKDPRELITEEQPREELEAIIARVSERDEWAGRVTLYHRGGEPFEVMLTSSTIRAANGEPGGFVTVSVPVESSTGTPRMRRARVHCAACGKEVAGTMRRKYCSEKCRQWAYYHRHLEAQRARSRQRHERRRAELDSEREQPPSGREAR